MKIAILHSAFTESGGAERVVINQAKSLMMVGHEVTCYVAAVKRSKCFPEELSKIVIKPYLLNLTSPKLQYTIALSLSLIAAPLVSNKFRKFDVLICHHEPAPWIAYQTWKKYGIPFVCYMHHPPRFIYPREVDKTLNWGHNYDRKTISSLERKLGIVKKFDFLAVSNAKAVLVNSKCVANEVENIYGIKPIVCYPGVDLPSLNGYADEITKKFGIKSPFILSTGRHTPHKRLEWLLDITNRISSKFNKFTLVIIGAFHPTYTIELRHIAQSIRCYNVIFLNYVTDEELAALYRQASVFAFTAPNEDFGLVPVEAMLSGTPVVCWDDGYGPSETVINGKVGYKVKPYDMDEFAEKVLEILRDNKLRRKLGEQAQEYAKENYGWDKHINTLVDALPPTKYTKCIP